MGRERPQKTRSEDIQQDLQERAAKSSSTSKGKGTKDKVLDLEKTVIVESTVALLLNQVTSYTNSAMMGNQSNGDGKKEESNGQARRKLETQMPRESTNWS
ncbi:hypothetical protein HAX54_007237, partial [Datura stramonium]|nr:hypothetical protein [Datura stramonium]